MVLLRSQSGGREAQQDQTEGQELFQNSSCLRSLEILGRLVEPVLGPKLLEPPLKPKINLMTRIEIDARATASHI